MHVQLATRTKLFCPCPNEPGGSPNTRVCPVCLGLPGALPVLNEAALDMALAAALALGADVGEETGFDRKSYFYPDLPKGYQITQKERPLAAGGECDLPGGGRVRLRQLHLEEDAGRTVHRSGARPASSLVDMNRCGVPLIEIVTEPDIESVAEADAFLRELRRTLSFLGVTSGRMQEGALRFDTNVSLRRNRGEALGAHTEIKNLNSFRAVRRALSAEIDRQRERLEKGLPVVHETMLWDEAAGRVAAMRSKEESQDYRYLAEPDLPAFRVDAGRLARVRAAMAELPGEKAARLAAEHGLSRTSAARVTRTPARAALFEQTVAGLSCLLGDEAAFDPETVVSWVTTVAPGVLRRAGARPRAGDSGRRVVDEAGSESGPELSVTELARELSTILAARTRGELSEASAKDVLEECLRSGRSASSVMEEHDLGVIDTPDELRGLARSVLEEHPSEVGRWLGGESRLLSFFMGEVMRRTEGRADPRAALEALERELEAMR